MNEIKVLMSTMRDDVELGKEFKIKVEIPKEMGECTNLEVLFNRYGEEPSVKKKLSLVGEKNGVNLYEAKVTLNILGTYYYFFYVTIDGYTSCIKINRKTNKPFLTNNESPYWRILVITKEFTVPSWAKGATFYQIFVDRFKKGIEDKPRKEGRNYRKWMEMPDFKRNSKGEFHNNDFFGGDLKGIEQSLKYIKKLGVSVIYLSPINYSLFRYDRYAATDHLEIDQDVGDFEDLKSLHTKANKMGMHIILDIALNHCSIDNPIFQEAISDKNSKYRDWFYINDDNSYKYWYGEFKDMPVFNQENTGYREYVRNVIEKFAKYVDGFRLDVAEELQYETLKLINECANKERKELIVGECWNKVPLERLGEAIDAPTNYLFTDAIYQWILYGRKDYFVNKVYDVMNNYPKETVCSMLNSLDTHDIARALTILNGKWMRNDREPWKIDEYPSKWHKRTNGRVIFLTDVFRNDEYSSDRLSKEEYCLAKKKLKQASVIQYTLPGNPCIFYGTEVGLHGYKDPFNRKCFPWGHFDLDLLRHYIRLGKFRKQKMDQLLDMNFKHIEASENVLMYERNDILVVVNRSDKLEKVNIPQEYSEILKSKRNMSKSEIEPYGWCILTK